METAYYILSGIALLALLVPGDPVMSFCDWLGNRTVELLTFGACNPNWRREHGSLVPRWIGLMIVAVLFALSAVILRR